MRMLSIVCSSGFVITLITLVYTGITFDTSWLLIHPVILTLLMIFFFFTAFLSGALYVQGSNHDIYE